MEDFVRHYYLGIENCKKGDFNGGISEFNKAISLNPNHVESIYNRAKAKFKLKLVEDCLEDFALALTIMPENPVLFSERAVVYYHLEENQNALNDLNKAVSLEPENSYRYASRAYIKDKIGDLEGAIEDYQKAIELDPEDAISHNNKGLVEEKLGYTNRAKISFRKADALTGFDENIKYSERSDIREHATIPPTPSQHDLKTQQKFGINSYLDVVKEIFTTRNGRNDFLSFVIDFFKGKRKRKN